MTSQFKNLVMNVVDAAAAYDFWGATLGMEGTARGGGFVLWGERSTDSIRIDRVPEPHEVKNRAHLDVYVSSVAELVERGAVVVEEFPRWTVLTDPDGGEFCAFVREPDQLPERKLYELVIDCVDPWALAQWWAERFDLEAQREPDEDDEDDEDDGAWLAGGSLPYPVVFGSVPEPKRRKNRVHWDVVGETAEFLIAGATLLRSRGDGLDWDVLADPAGNEFCVFSPI